MKVSLFYGVGKFIHFFILILGVDALNIFKLDNICVVNTNRYTIMKKVPTETVLRVAYIANSESKKETAPRVDNVALRIQRRYHADFRKALKEHAELIKEMQKRVPGWMPTMPTEEEMKKALRKQSLLVNK